MIFNLWYSYVYFIFHRMSNFFSDDTLSLIKDRLPVSEVIRRRVVLKQKGKDFLGLCPFHGEKSPSFTVNDNKGFYHCFGCGVHGDIFKFLTDYEKLTFQEAVEQAASIAGVTLKPLNPQQQKVMAERDQLFKLLDDTGKLFQSTLSSDIAKPYYDYLRSRGITDASIQKFQIGAASKGQLTKFIAAQNISLDLAEKAGVMARYDTGVKEKFFERLMFPIFDEKSRIVGFGGRTLSDDVQPKYLNSSENALFHKGSLLYGFHLIDYKNSSAVLVEGYLDVIAMTQSDYKNVFAPMGTAVTQDQANKLIKHFNKIYLCFDGDSAGFKAMNRATEVFLPLLQPGIELLFVRLPAKQDPHNMITSGDLNTFKQKISAPQGLVEFLAAYESTQSPGSHPAAMALQRKHILDRIDLIQDTYLKSLYKDETYTLFQIKRKTKQHQPMGTIPKTIIIQDIYELVLLKAFMICPALYKDFMDQLHAYPFTPYTQKIINVIENYIFLGDSLEFLSIVPYIKLHLPMLNIDHILSDTFHVHAPFLNEPIDVVNIRNGIERILGQFNESTSLETHIKEAQERFKQSQSQTDWDRLRMLMAQKQHRNDDEL
jgi:DNA primase catalytic core